MGYLCLFYTLSHKKNIPNIFSCLYSASLDYSNLWQECFVESFKQRWHKPTLSNRVRATYALLGCHTSSSQRRPSASARAYAAHGPFSRFCTTLSASCIHKGSPYSITERRVPELIPVLGIQPAGDVSHKPGGRLPLLSARPAVTPATLRGLLPISLLGEQRHDRCEQFA